MDDKVQELASKIYNDGIAKADSQAQQIIAEAEKKRDEILEQASRRAQEILTHANQETADLRENSEKEIQLSADRAADALRTEITDMINERAVTKGVDKAFADPEKLYGVVLHLCEKLIDDGSNSVTVSTEDAETVERYFHAHAAEKISNGMEVKAVRGREASFVISPESKGYEIVISKEALVEYFKDFMRPRLRDMLFAKDEEKE